MCSMAVSRIGSAVIQSLAAIARMIVAALPGARAADETMAEGLAAPASKDDLRGLEERWRKVAGTVLPCTVGVEVGGGSGSRVIVSEDGFVLTAGHVSGTPGRKVMIVLQAFRESMIPASAGRRGTSPRAGRPRCGCFRASRHRFRPIPQPPAPYGRCGSRSTSL